MKPSSPSPVAILALISLPIFVGALDLTVVSAVLPQVIFDLEIPQTEINQAAWIVTGYLLAYTVAMTFMGRLSDLIGRRNVFLAALVIFSIGSYWVAVADDWPVRLALRVYYAFFEGRPDPARVALMVLIAGRMVQAFGGGAMVPVGMALVGDLYPAGQRARPLGWIAAIDTAGWVVGHLYGGILTRLFDWRMIFWLNLPLCALAFGLIFWSLRRLPAAKAPGQMDWPGAALISACLTALNLGLGSAETGGTFNPSDQPDGIVWSWVAAAAFCLGLFLWREATTAWPLVPLHLFRRVNFSASGAANLLTGFALFIAIANVPLFINTLVAQTLEQGAWDSGWMLSALTVPMALAAIPGGWLTVRWGYRWLGWIGLTVAALGFGWMTLWRAATPYGAMIPSLAVTGIGLGLTIAPIAAAAINSAESTDRGVASALVIMFRLVGMTLSVSAVSTYGQLRFNALSARLLASGEDMAQAAIDAVTMVISETFWLAAIICLLAWLPVFMLKKERRMDNE
jgi:MFS family permease